MCRNTLLSPLFFLVISNNDKIIISGIIFNALRSKVCYIGGNDHRVNRLNILRLKWREREKRDKKNVKDKGKERKRMGILAVYKRVYYRCISIE